MPSSPIKGYLNPPRLRAWDGSDEPPGPARSGERAFRGDRRGNDIPRLDHDPQRPTPDARLCRKARCQATKLCYMGHLFMGNRTDPVVDTGTTHATGTAEREAVEAMVGEAAEFGWITRGTDRAFVAEHVLDLREGNAIPHVAQNTTDRCSAIDGCTTRRPGQAAS